MVPVLLNARRRQNRPGGRGIGKKRAPGGQTVWSLQTALTVVPLFSLLAMAAFMRATRTYDADMRAVAGVRVSAD